MFLFFNRGVRLTFARFRKFEGFRFFDGEFGGRVDDDRLRKVFALHGVGVGVRQLDTHVAFRFFNLRVFFEGRALFADDLDAFEIRKTNRLFLVDLRRLNDLLTIRFARSNRLVFTRVSDLNRFVLFRVRNADFTHSLVVGDVAARLLNRFRRRFLTDRFDVARFVRDVRDVDVD